LLAHENAGEVARMKSRTGWTALLLAVCYSRVFSTKSTVAHLLAHESGSDVARMQDTRGWTALTVAMCQLGTTSSEAAVARLVAHKSGGEVLHLRNHQEQNVLDCFIQHAKGTEYLFQLLTPHATQAEFLRLCVVYPNHVSAYFF
jgi:hypothetical protein